MKWKQIYNLNYEVSDSGTIRNKKRRNLMTQFKIGRTDYLAVFLEVDGKQKIHAVHRLVAIAFLKKRDGCKEVNHKDGNKRNNHISNLSWVTRSENMKHMYDTGLKTYKPMHYKGKFGAEHNRSKSVICKESGFFYGSMSEAARELKIDVSSVSWAIKHNKPIYGMHFELSQ